MIVDMHTHYIDDPQALEPKLRADLKGCGLKPESWVHSEEEYLSATAAADKVVVFGLRGKATGWNVSNERVAQFVRRHPEKYIYFTSIDPQDVDALEQLRYEHQINGAKGLKLAPIYQGRRCMDPDYIPMYTYCQRMGLPILFHMGTSFTSGVPIEYTKPMNIDEVACAFPDLKMVIAHVAHPWEGEALAVIRRNRNVYADIAALYYRPWQFYNTMRLAMEYGCTHKLIFGSDFPATTTQDSVRGVLNMNGIIQNTGLPKVSDEILERIVYGNPLGALGIEQGGKSE